MAKRTISGKIFKDRADTIARYSKYDGYQKELAGMMDKFSYTRIGSKGK